MPDMETDETLRPQALGTEETLAPSGAESTLKGDGSEVATGGNTPAGAPRGAGDYGEPVTIEPTHYIRGEQIAKGGMGRIVAARDRRLGRDVAIKELISPTLALRD